MPLDLSVTKLLVLGLLAMLIFGPEKLPELARDAARMLRQFRGMAQQARSELRSEFSDVVPDFDVRDLNPRTFVRKHLLDDDMSAAGILSEVRSVMAEATAPVGGASTTPGPALADGESAPFDPDAT